MAVECVEGEAIVDVMLQDDDWAIVEAVSVVGEAVDCAGEGGVYGRSRLCKQIQPDMNGPPFIPIIAGDTEAVGRVDASRFVVTADADFFCRRGRRGERGVGGGILGHRGEKEHGKRFSVIGVLELAEEQTARSEIENSGW